MHPCLGGKLKQVTWLEPRRRELGSRDWSLDMSSLTSSSEMEPRDDLLLDIFFLAAATSLAGRDEQAS